MEIVPSDPALKQFLGDEDFGQMGETFRELAESGKSLTRLPQRQFSRRQVLEAIDEAFQLVGGVPRMAMWAHHNYTEFMKLYGKTVPAASQMEIMGKVQHIIRPALPRSALDGDYEKVSDGSTAGRTDTNTGGV